MSTNIDGVDVSKWQGKIDWSEAATQTGFAIVKATQGVSELDADYVRNIRALRKANEHRGSYHYPDAGDPVAEADYYVKHAHRKNGEMQALDFEGAVLQLADPVAWAARWLERVIARTDNVPLIYMSGSVVHAHDWRPVINLGAGLWCASWDVRPDPGQWPFAIMWQRDDSGQLRGINGRVDEDVFFGNPKTWAAYANNRHGAPKVRVRKPVVAKKPATSPAPPKPAPKPASKPVKKPEPPAPKPPAVHTIRAGDTLSGIAHAAGVSTAQLVTWNKAAYPSLTWNPNLIEVGWHLRTAA